jgi:hypothetical protein
MHSASAKWTVTTEGAPSGCSHVISDGNWKIGVYRYSDDNWSLGKKVGINGSAYLAGSDDLDLTGLAADCGVVLKCSNNGALEKNNNITSVRFPDSLESTAGNTFKECKNLTNMVFGTGFKTVGGEMFRSCSALKTVMFPPGLETIGSYGFNGCSALELDNFTFPATVTSMGDHAFTGCTKITGMLTFPGLTTMSGTYQFEDCKGMTGFSAPSLCTIQQGMFNRCTALASASFSDDLASIGANAFNNSGALVSFYPTTMPKLASIGNEAFRSQKLLVGNFDFSLSAITELPYYAFVDDAKVGNVYLPEGLTNIRGAALGYGKKARVVWFCGPPPAMDSDALNPKGGNSWVLVAGRKHAAEWKANEHVETITDAERATAKTAAESFGLKGFKPIGKWTYQTGGYTHWVVEEPISGFITVVR